jgi:hypothetical protein
VSEREKERRKTTGKKEEEKKMPNISDCNEGKNV